MTVDSQTREKYVKRLEDELDMIRSMGFSGYFLIVADFIRYAKSRNIPVGPAGIGSGKPRCLFHWNYQCRSHTL
jgi:DNA polymerase-3 subunit alpha